ncbi:MAG: hypothetical protein A2X97_02970 [Bdellovibrionales bacterium GWA1_52_35]|nr:MAG: hypothetical protein A2X97_02970 [Bdellovibrionales bacterium GWA1_52_35]HCM40155.1 Na-K-Cl cotransporter [Bdellovibrionales bacterium]
MAGPPSHKTYGTFQGVFLPSILTIFGVIMYLRLGWVVGTVGLFGALIIVSIANAITFITGLSISATATNMKVGGGGAYYMISRSFGIEAGAAIGIPLYLAQALGISFYITGFSESLHVLLPMLPILWISLASLLVLSILTYFSTDLALKAQFFIFLIVVASLVSFFMGAPPAEGFTAAKIALPPASFWIAFAVFFPAVTGIEAGIAMSGDLKNSARSLPLGTMSAVVLGYVVYMAIPVFLSKHVPREVLLTNNMVMRDLAVFGFAVTAGIWGATLSSALGSLLGAPRTLQALAQDGVLPHFLGKGFGPTQEPRLATAVSFLIALGGILLGDLNLIAPILSMFFLTSYGALNLAAGLEGLLGNPSWRPTFRSPWALSLAGAGLCLAVMLMIDPGATFIASFAIIAIYHLMQRRNLRARWGDMRRGILMFFAKQSLYKLEETPPEPRSWRPNILVLSGAPAARWYLIELADALTRGRSFLTVASIVPKVTATEERLESLVKSVRQFLKSRGVRALVEVVSAENVLVGAQSLIRTYGMGPLFPNTFLLGETEKEENFAQFADLILSVYRSRRNLMIVRQGKKEKAAHAEGLSIETRKTSSKKQIDVWWGGRGGNAGLMLVLAYMLQTTTTWRGATLTLRYLVKNEEEKERASEHLKALLTEGRVSAKLDVILAEPDEDPLKMIAERSAAADMIFLGIKPPAAEETIESYRDYYAGLLSRSEGFPTAAFVLAGQDISFEDILK